LRSLPRGPSATRAAISSSARARTSSISLDKTTSLTERFKIQFRSEFFNILNHPNFTLPNVQVDGGSSFTTVTSTPDVAGSNPRLGDGGPRLIQFALKLLF
jgi:hypothetical protein